LCYLLTLPATRALYPLSLHDALPICAGNSGAVQGRGAGGGGAVAFDDGFARRNTRRHVELHGLGQRFYNRARGGQASANLSASEDRKSTRLNSSHQIISYAVFCLKKK